VIERGVRILADVAADLPLPRGGSPDHRIVV
jgi:hypothetical protein